MAVEVFNGHYIPPGESLRPRAASAEERVELAARREQARRDRESNVNMDLVEYFTQQWAEVHELDYYHD
ncbi:hypothetical protein DPMN_085405 [Dreissena polymorpha]|uniref:Uncharacterized protein n=1 Tax=Dreissena polymorpha TaxID=45954 RepID=A0A9D3YCM5_DREPO|nr:hypothetical protein DPMN_085405 [Dreissena polymorpha]